MKLSLVLHAHQPPGNYDWVFREGLKTSYGPVADALEARPSLRLSLHYSGPLLQWMERNAPERIEQLQRLVERGQVEIVAAGMYEPVLALLPPRDRVGQLLAHRAYLQRLFGVDTQVGWLTERVWEPVMAGALADGGIRTVTLDDRHLLSAGVEPEALDIPYMTESLGKTLVIAPASEDLREYIPWRSAKDALALVRRKAARGDRLAVYADDFEKFGMWPGTYEAVIAGGWLDEFFDGLVRIHEGDDDIDVVPVGEAVEAVGVGGRVYVPDGSYPEMLEWSLPVPAQRALSAAKQAMKDAGVLEQSSRFLRAGQYLEFLAKYPEVNYLHKRMLDVSERVGAKYRRLDGQHPDELPEAVRELWSAQANCAYWHGLFGGIYLAHIRHRLWYHLLRAECALEADGAKRQLLRVFDLDADRDDEFMVTTDDLVVVVDPNEGAVVELSHRPSATNVVDTIALREEIYHGDISEEPWHYDRGRRACFIDRFLAPGKPPTRNAMVEDLGDFEGQPYEARARKASGSVTVDLSREGAAPGGIARVEKTLRITGDVARIDAEYRVTAAEGEIDARFGIELNLGILFRDKPKGMLEAAAKSMRLPKGGALRGVDAFTIEMQGIDVRLRIETTVADLDVRPIESVSRSEGGFDTTPQQLAVLLTWPVRLKAGDEFGPRVSVTLEATGGSR